MSVLFITLFLYRRFFLYRDFKILAATQRRIDRKSDGSVVTYHVKVRTRKSSEELAFKEVWLNQKRYAVKLSSEDHKIKSAFQCDEILTLHLSIELPHPGPGAPVPSGRSAAENCAIGYSVGNKCKFLAVPGFREAKLYSVSGKTAVST